MKRKKYTAAELASMIDKCPIRPLKVYQHVLSGNYYKVNAIAYDTKECCLKVIYRRLIRNNAKNSWEYMEPSIPFDKSVVEFDNKFEISDIMPLSVY